MKNRTACVVDELNCMTEYEDDLMDCADFMDLVKLTKEMGGGDVDIYIMAERIASLLGHDDVISPEDDLDEDADDVTDNTRVEWTDNLEHNLLVAGYTDCMDEAIRYLVEEEQYSLEHPVVQGLKHHLVSQQERVVGEAARGANNNLTDANSKPSPAQRVDSCTLRLPSRERQ